MDTPESEVLFQGYSWPGRPSGVFAEALGLIETPRCPARTRTLPLGSWLHRPPLAKLQGGQSPWVAARSPPGGRRDCQVSPAPGPGPARTGKGVTAGEAGGAAGRRHFWYFQVVPAWKQARTSSASVPQLVGNFPMPGAAVR